MATKKISDVIQEELSTENWVEKEFSAPNRRIRLATDYFTENEPSIFI